MNITGHNSYSGCRFCDIQGVYSQKHKHIYFSNTKRKCIKKNHSNWLMHINEIEAAAINSEKEMLIKKYGKNYCFIVKLLLWFNLITLHI
jgi:hypothetical protein